MWTSVHRRGRKAGGLRLEGIKLCPLMLSLLKTLSDSQGTSKTRLTHLGGQLFIKPQRKSGTPEIVALVSMVGVNPKMPSEWEVERRNFGFLKEEPKQTDAGKTLTIEAMEENGRGAMIRVLSWEGKKSLKIPC